MKIPIKLDIEVLEKHRSHCSPNCPFFSKHGPAYTVGVKGKKNGWESDKDRRWCYLGPGSDPDVLGYQIGFQNPPTLRHTRTELCEEAGRRMGW